MLVMITTYRTGSTTGLLLLSPIVWSLVSLINLSIWTYSFACSFYTSKSQAERLAGKKFVPRIRMPHILVLFLCSFVAVF